MTMTNSFGRSSFSAGNNSTPHNLRNSFSAAKDQKSNLKTSIIPSSQIFIAMSQGNVSSDSSSEDETFIDPLFEKFVSLKTDS